MTLFDPETGKVNDPEGLRSVQFAGGPAVDIKSTVVDGKKVTPFVNETTGRVGGYDTEHASGRVDVNIQAEAVRASAGSAL